MTEPTTVGLSTEGHDLLRRLKEDGHFAEMIDAYRFAIALAIAHGADARPLQSRGTIFNVGTLDPDRHIYTVIKALYTTTEEPAYGIAERLADWGVFELARRTQSASFSFSEILEEVASIGGGREN